MCKDDNRHDVAMFMRRLLDDSFDADTVFTEYFRYRCQHARLVFRQQAKEIGGVDVFYWKHGYVFKGIGLECQVRHTVFRVRCQGTDKIHNVGDHRGGRRLRAGTRAIVQRRTNGIGIHQHGMLQHASTYEIMRPEDVGLAKSSLVLGKHSGRHAFRDRVRELGFELDEFETNRAFQAFKKLADRKKDVYDSDIEAIIMNADSMSPGPWLLSSLQVHTRSGEDAEAAVALQGETGDESRAAARGDGPIAASFLALEKATGVDLVLRNFEVHSTSVGEDAQGEVTVTVEHDGTSYRGHGTSVDIVEAGARAYLEVINRVLRRQSSNAAPRSGPGGASRATI